MPELSDAERHKIARGVWDVLGRVMAEYPHMSKFDIEGPNARIEVVGAEHVRTLADDGKPGIFIVPLRKLGNHVAGWVEDGVRYSRSLSPPNNPWLVKLLHHARRAVTTRSGQRGWRGFAILCGS